MALAVRGQQTVVMELDGVEERLASIDRTLTSMKAMVETLANGQVTLAQAVAEVATSLIANTASDIRMEEIVSDLTGVVSDLETRVSDQTTVIGGATALLDGLTTVITDLRDDLANAGVDPALVARLSGVAEAVSSGTTTLSAAVVRNTPAEDTEPVPDPEPTPDEPTPDV